MKNIYIKPVLEIVTFEQTDVISVSANQDKLNLADTDGLNYSDLGE